MRSYFKLSFRTLDFIKNGSVVSLSDNTNENLTVKVSGTNVIMFYGNSSFVAGSTESHTDEIIINNINRALKTYLNSKYETETVIEYDWGWQAFNNIERENYVSGLIRDYLADNSAFETVYISDDEIIAEFKIMGETQPIHFNLTSDDDNNVEVYINDDYENEISFTYDDDSFERGNEYMIKVLTENINEIIKDTVSDFINEKF